MTYAWMYGQHARTDGKERAVPEYWAEYAEAWLQGFDGVPIGSEPKPVSEGLEAELDESAISQPE